MTRRQLLAALAALGVAPRALAFGDTNKVDIVELDLEGTESRPNAWKRLLYSVVNTTAVSCRTEIERLDPADPSLFEHPFAVIIGSERFAMPSQDGLQQLSRFLSYGGFLLFDDTSGADNSGFDASVRELCAALFPTRPLAPIPADHSVYRTFFLLDAPLGRVDRFSFLEGITVGDVSPVLYCRNDVSGALDRGSNGLDLRPVVPGGERQRREALKLGINLIMYALTANYKKDQVHVRRLLLEGRLE